MNNHYLSTSILHPSPFENYYLELILTWITRGLAPMQTNKLGFSWARLYKHFFAKKCGKTVNLCLVHPLFTGKGAKMS